MDKFDWSSILLDFGEISSIILGKYMQKYKRKGLIWSVEAHIGVTSILISQVKCKCLIFTRCDEKCDM